MSDVTLFLLAQMGGTLVGVVLCVLMGVWYGRRGA